MFATHALCEWALLPVTTSAKFAIRAILSVCKGNGAYSVYMYVCVHTFFLLSWRSLLNKEKKGMCRGRPGTVVGKDNLLQHL